MLVIAVSGAKTFNTSADSHWTVWVGGPGAARCKQ